MHLVVLESPFAATNERSINDNVAYARACMRDCIGRGEAPIASHLLYTQPGILDDANLKERQLGIWMGLEWAMKCDYAVFYTDHGMSMGMWNAQEFYRTHGINFEMRKLK